MAEDLEFLGLYPGNAAITIVLPSGQVQRIDRVSASLIGDKCPLLFYCFENGPVNDQQASIEATSIALVISFLRYIYTGNYLTETQEIGPHSLLHHAEMYKMAIDYDVPELQVSAHVNFMRETEVSCCVPHPPLDLCAAIEFVYQHLASQQPLIDTLLHYCVSSFKYHGLGTDSIFRQLAFDVPAFQRALCQTNLKRDFQDEGASDIVQLPVCRPNPLSVVLDRIDLHMDSRTHSEFQFHEWYDSEVGSADIEPEIKTENAQGDDLKSGILKTDSLKSENLKSDSLESKNLKVDDLKQDNFKNDGVKNDSLKTHHFRNDHVKIDDLESDNIDSDSCKTESPRKRRKTLAEADFILVHRPKETGGVSDSEEHVANNTSGFTEVLRPKTHLVSDLFPGIEEANAGFEIISEVMSDNEGSAKAPNIGSPTGSDSEWSII